MEVYDFFIYIFGILKWLLGSGVLSYLILRIVKWFKPELNLSLANITSNVTFIKLQHNVIKSQNSKSVPLINKQSDWAEEALNLNDEYLREMREWFDYMYIQDLRECHKKFRFIQNNILQKTKDLVNRLDEKKPIITLIEELEVAVRGLPGCLETTNRNNFPTHLVLQAADRLHNAPDIVESYVVSIRCKLAKIAEKKN